MEQSGSLDFVALGGRGGGKKADAPSILVISPHPDDDVIGMGGAMRLFADEGRQVFSVYITDGTEAGSDAGAAGALRCREALAALKIVRARGAFFLHHASASLKSGAAGKASRQLQAILALLQPAELYLPSPFERHPTHRRVTRIALEAVSIKKFRQVRIWGYSVWGGIYGLPGTRAVDISRCLRVKRKAMRRHVSQMAKKPYDRGALGRNAYEGAYLQTHGGPCPQGAELFIDMARLRSWKWAEGLAGAIAGGGRPAASD
ncbi:MAG: PIG-L family deacetylase [Deltaproteobacteria bacterium]|nr:PIG-L family deacetylase [Deltaproteobacteria bacterium]